MKNEKKPVYLWILGILSLILSILGVYGVFSPIPDFSSVDLTGLPQEQVDLVQQQFRFSSLVAEFGHNLPNIILAVLGLILIISVIVLLVKKNVLYANFVYFAYVLLGIIGTIYAYVGSRSAVAAVYTDEATRSAAMLVTNIATVLYIVINIIFLAIVGYKLYRQNQEADNLEEA